MLPKNYGKENATRVAAVLWLYSLLVVLSTALNWAIYLLLRSPGRDDSERVVAYLESCDWDVWISGGRAV